LRALRSGPDIPGGVQRDDLAPGILTLHVARNGRKGRHFIVFRVGDDHVIDVLRLLHDSMDLSSHLPASEE
jgi:toxin ParE1/3/4